MRTPDQEPPTLAAQDGAADRFHQELWFTLARTEWRSLVLVPADPGASTEALARALADVGGRLGDGPVTAVAVSTLAYGSAAALAEMQQHLAREPGSQPAPRAPGAPRLVISIPPVVSEPLGLAAAQRADAVVVTATLGRTRVADVDRTVELVGRDRIAGCVLVR